LSDSRLLDFDPVSKVRRVLHMDGDLVHAAATQDISDHMDINKALYNEQRPGWQEGQRVASIPNVIWEDLVRRGIANDTKKLKAWLNDPDNRAFRTRPGRV
jgi:hypothetical protein